MRTLLTIVCVTSLCVMATAQEPPRGFQGTGPLLGIAENGPKPPLKLKWQYRTNEDDRASVEGSPVIAGDRVYIADGTGGLHCLELATGKVAWKQTAPEGFATTPLIHDGKLFIGDLIGKFHAFGLADGKLLWSVDAQSTINASANIVDGKILFGTDGAEVYCVSAADGKVLWTAKTGDRVNATPSVGGGMTFVSGCDAMLRGIDLQTGQEKFAAELTALAPGSAAFLKDRVVVGTDQGRVVCISADGKKIHWTYEGVENQQMVYASPAVSAGDGVVVIGARDRRVHAIDLATGKGLWTFKTRGDVDGAAMVSDGRVYICSKDRRLYVLDLKSGQKLGEFLAGRGIVGGVSISKGLLVLADTAGNVYCLEGEK